MRLADRRLTGPDRVESGWAVQRRTPKRNRKAARRGGVLSDRENGGRREGRFVFDGRRIGPFRSARTFSAKSGRRSSHRVFPGKGHGVRSNNLPFSRAIRASPAPSNPVRRSMVPGRCRLQRRRHRTIRFSGSRFIPGRAQWTRWVERRTDERQSGRLDDAPEAIRDRQPERPPAANPCGEVETHSPVAVRCGVGEKGNGKTRGEKTWCGGNFGANYSLSRSFARKHPTSPAPQGVRGATAGG